MDTVLIGQRVKFIRQKRKMSQRDLADGICTQALISHIEKGKTKPTVDLFYKLAQKLSVPVEHFFDYHESRFDLILDMMHENGFEFILDVMREIRQLIEERNYEEAQLQLNKEKENPLFKKDYFRQFLLWHEGILCYCLTRDTKKAQEKLKSALSITYQQGVPHSEREVEILISLANINYNESAFNKAREIYKQLTTSILKLKHINNPKLIVRLYFNYAQTLSSLSLHPEALEMSEKGVRMCKEFQLLYLFGDLNYQVGYNLLKMNKSKGVVYLEKAKQIFLLNDNEEYAQYCQDEIEKYYNSH